MLEQLIAQHVEETVFRYANLQDEVDFLQRMGLGAETIDEIRALLSQRQEVDSPETLLDSPFRPKPQLEKYGLRSRYSDGSIRVFYSSLERETAEAEVRHHIRRTLTSNATTQRTIYYQRFSCRFSGTTKDLRVMHHEWPWLTGEDVSLCNDVAREAIAQRLDGLLVPSARREKGACVPVFNRGAISNPSTEEIVSFTFDPSTSNFYQ